MKIKVNIWQNFKVSLDTQTAKFSTIPVPALVRRQLAVLGVGGGWGAGVGWLCMTKGPGVGSEMCECQK